MLPLPEHFSSVTLDRMEYDPIKTQHDLFMERLETSTDAETHIQIIQDWDTLQRTFDTWSSLVYLRFSQDTGNEDYKKERMYSDELSPKIESLQVAFKRKVLSLKTMPALRAHFGDQLFDLWSSHLASFEPSIQDLTVEENKLRGQYTEVLGGAKISFRGEELNLSQIGPHLSHEERETREEAHRARWTWFAANRPELDRIYGELVRVRTEMARTLGYEDFVELGYARMARIDYTREDVQRFRQQVVEKVVPIVSFLRKEQAKLLGVDTLMCWDEPVQDPKGNPKPAGDHDWMVQRAQGMFDTIHKDLGEFFRVLTDHGLLDLKSREGKAPGGFCTSFSDYGVPFVFANFNGTQHDVTVLTHEIGHAFQNWKSRTQPVSDYLWPTYESCEIHSMSLEYLTFPHMDAFFEEDAERFRRGHLIGSLNFIPYGVAVDHFQHLIYENPDATPEERHAMWQKMEATYLPWRNWGDIPHGSEGGQWQAQRHIYEAPFYYIDYTLALTCALQFWEQSSEDMDDALERYIALCKRGGEAPFQALAHSAGLISPFDAGCLDNVVNHVRSELNLQV